MVNKYQLLLSKEANQDLDSIYVNGYLKWGEARADQYYGNSPTPK